MPRFVVGALMQGNAILVAEDHQVVDFPSHLLPADVYIGCVIELNISVQPEHQKERIASLHAVFEAIEAEVQGELKMRPSQLERQKEFETTITQLHNNDTTLRRIR